MYSAGQVTLTISLKDDYIDKVVQAALKHEIVKLGVRSDVRVGDRNFSEEARRAAEKLKAEGMLSISVPIAAGQVALLLAKKWGRSSVETPSASAQKTLRELRLETLGEFDLSGATFTHGGLSETGKAKDDVYASFLASISRSRKETAAIGEEIREMKGIRIFGNIHVKGFWNAGESGFRLCFGECSPDTVPVSIDARPQTVDESKKSE